jgi:uncharacterized protein YecE (DUF72 family)
MPPRIYVGCAGWTLPRAVQPAFPAEGTHLARYAARFPAAEINTSFYRPHRPATYERWAASVPEGFRFSVKVPKAITHERRLADADAPLAELLEQLAGLGDRLGCLLVQLPPSLEYDEAVVRAFARALRARFGGAVAVEPRHESWFAPAAARLLAEHAMARAAADPARVPAAGEPGGWTETVYYRLHGSPRIYYSSYGDDRLDALAASLRAAAERAEAWCIFDNTASGAATADALGLLARLDTHASPAAGGCDG